MGKPFFDDSKIWIDKNVFKKNGNKKSHIEQDF